MKRFFTLLTILSVLLFDIGTYAADVFYCEYVPKTESGSVFYIDICCRRELSAAVMELGYDSGAVEYRSATSDHEVSARAADGRVYVAVAGNPAFSGTLCRLAFKALRTGPCSFELRMKQACDGDLSYVTDLPDYTLSVSFAEKDVVSAGGSDKRSASTEKSGGRSRSSKSGDSSYISTSDEEGGKAPSGGVFDMRRDNAWTYILIGAGSALLVALLIVLGIVIGRRLPSKKQKPDDDLPEYDAPEDFDGEDYEDFYNNESESSDDGNEDNGFDPYDELDDPDTAQDTDEADSDVDIDVYDPDASENKEDF